MSEYAVIGMDPGGLDQLRSIFLERIPDFGDFTDRVGEYWNSEREYKDSLRELAATELPRSLFENPTSPVAANAVVEATLRTLTRRVHGGGESLSQNLITWRYFEFLRDLDPPAKEQFATSLGMLLYGEGTEPDRVGRFTEQVWPLYRLEPGKNPYALSRIFPTFFLMLLSPRANIAVRSDMFQSASKLLLGRSILAAEPFGASAYRDLLTFSEAVFRQLQSWAWRPRDMIDVHSFLWIATSKTYGKSADPSA
jgi:hypothetical protein